MRASIGLKSNDSKRVQMLQSFADYLSPCCIAQAQIRFDKALSGCKSTTFQPNNNVARDLRGGHSHI